MSRVNFVCECACNLPSILSYRPGTVRGIVSLNFDELTIIARLGGRDPARSLGCLCQTRVGVGKLAETLH